MAGMIENVSINVPCPECGKRTKKTMKWVQSNPTMPCECGATVDLDANEETRAIRELKTALKRLDGHPFT